MTLSYSSPISTSDKYIEEKEELIFSVSEYLEYINIAIKPLSGTIQGEIGKISTSGPGTYFTLCDKKEKAVVNCVIWNSLLKNLGFDLKEGMEVKVIGYPEIYKPYGKFSLMAKYISPVGEGALKLAFEKLKKELEQAGYFDEKRKRKLPQFIETIGIITSQSGVVITDFLTGLGSHGFKIAFYDSRVEGASAIENIIEAISWFNELALPLDVLVIARGGGSMESLQAFNSFEVAKAILSSKTPIITAIGHERDVTIADLVADVRASVPMHAGKMIAEPWNQIGERITYIEEKIIEKYKNKCKELDAQLNYFQKTMTSQYEDRLKQCNTDLIDYQKNLIICFKNMLQKIQIIERNFTNNYERFQHHFKQQSKQISDLNISVQKDARNWYVNLTSTVINHEKMLKNCDPQLKLKQGYSITKDKHGNVIKSCAQTAIGDIITVQLFEGQLDSKIEEFK